MNGTSAVATPEQRAAPEPSAAPLPASPPGTSPQPTTGLPALQAGAGNAALAAAATNGSPPPYGDALSLQSTYGNAAVARSFPQPQAADQAAPAAATTPALIVEDTVEAPEAGQMKKSDFLAELQSAVCRTAAEVLADTPWSEKGCPYIEHWFGYYRSQDARHVERAVRKYASEAGGATAARDYIPIICARMRGPIEVWAKTGQITGVPEGLPMPLPNVPTAGSTPTSDTVAGTTTASANASPILPKALDGGAREAGDPQAIQAHLGAGRPLDADVQSRMGAAFGQDFSRVQLHTDATADRLSSDLNARAFAVGEHVAFGSGEYQPGTLVGDALIAHELAHTVQQRGATTAAQGAIVQNSSLEKSADEAAASALLRPSFGARPRPKLPTAGGLRLQRCGPEVPNQTVNWEDVNREEYEASVKKIRDLHEQENKLLSQAGWDDRRSDQLAKIRDDISEQVQKLQGLGVRRDAPDILKMLLQDVPQDLRQVTGNIQGGSESIYWGEPRKLDLHLDYLPKNVDWWVQWSYEPNTADTNPLVQGSKPRKDLSITLDGPFWASFDRFGGSPDLAARRTQTPGMSIVAKLFLGSQQSPAGTFSTQFMELKQEVPSSFTIEAPRVLNLPTPGATAAPNQPPPTTAYAMKDAETEFRLSWSPPLQFTRNPKYHVLWWVKEPGVSTPNERKDLQQWSVTLPLKKLGENTVGAKIFKWDQEPTDTPILSASKSVQCVTHEELGKLAVTQAEKQAPNADYQKYLADLDKQIADTEETAKAGTVAPRILGERLEALKEQRKKVLDQVGGKSSVPFPATDAGFNENTVHVTNIVAVLSMPEYGGAFPLSVFVTIWKNSGAWKARITDATTQDVIGWPGSASTPLDAVKVAINEWQKSNEYPQGGSLHYSLSACGWNLKSSFGTSTFKKEFWEWFDRILFISSAIVALVLILAPDPTGATKVAGLALLGIGILRSAIKVYENLKVGRSVLDKRNVLEAINMVASVIGLKGGMMMGQAGKGVALGETLTGSALTTFKVGKGLVVMTAAVDVGTFVYIAGDAIAQLQAAANDPNVTESQRERIVLETYLRLVTQSLLIIGTNAQLFRGATPKGTNIGMFLDKVAGPNAEIRLDASMRTSLLAEFRKINPEADTTKLTDRELVMGLQAIRTRAQVSKRLSDIRDSLDAKGKDAFDRKRAEFKSPEEFSQAIDAAGGQPKDYFARLAADPAFMSKKAGPDMPYAEQMQRLRTIDPKSRIELAPSKSILVHDAGIDIAPDNQIRINGQIDVHPTALKEIPEADLKILLETTRGIKELRGKPNNAKVVAEQAALRKALSNFTATGGYRYRFEFQREQALAQIEELGVKGHPLFANISPEGKNRLFDLREEGKLTGAPNLRKQAANWALSRNPQSVNEFVDLCQFYMRKFEAKAAAKLEAFNAEVAKRMADTPKANRNKIVTTQVG